VTSQETHPPSPAPSRSSRGSEDSQPTARGRRNRERASHWLRNARSAPRRWVGGRPFGPLPCLSSVLSCPGRPSVLGSFSWLAAASAWTSQPFIARPPPACYCLLLCMYCCCYVCTAAAAAQAASAPATWVTHARVAAGRASRWAPADTGRSERATWRVGRTQGRHREAYTPLSRELGWVWRLLACLVGCSVAQGCDL
jgi:hypothetical protein